MKTACRGAHKYWAEIALVVKQDPLNLIGVVPA